MRESFFWKITFFAAPHPQWPEAQRRRWPLGDEHSALNTGCRQEEGSWLRKDSHLPGYHILPLGSTWGERMERDLETVTSGEQIHIFDKRPDTWPSAAHHLQVGSSTRRQARRLKLFSGKQSSYYVPGAVTLLCEGGERAPRARTHTGVLLCSPGAPHVLVRNPYPCLIHLCVCSGWGLRTVE